MVAKLTLALALMFLAVGAFLASAGPEKGGQTASAPLGSGGGDLVPHW
jgi:hypothetical protein